MGTMWLIRQLPPSLCWLYMWDFQLACGLVDDKQHPSHMYWNVASDPSIVGWILLLLIHTHNFHEPTVWGKCRVWFTSYDYRATVIVTLYTESIWFGQSICNKLMVVVLRSVLRLSMDQSICSSAVTYLCMVLCCAWDSGSFLLASPS